MVGGLVKEESRVPEVEAEVEITPTLGAESVTWKEGQSINMSR